MNKALSGSSFEGKEIFIIKDFIEKNNRSIIYIAKDDREIFNLKDKLKWFFSENIILIFRSWDNIPYDSVSPSRLIQAERINTLNQIKNINKKIIILTSVNAILQKTINSKFINDYFFTIKKNTNINYNELIKKLTLLGFEKTSVVREVSEFAVRGSIIDLFLSDNKNPLRLDFFDNFLSNIYEFDKFTQKKINQVTNEITISPTSELIINNDSLNKFRSSFRNLFTDYMHSYTYNSFSDFHFPKGGENFLPLFNDKLSNIFSYCKNYTIILNNNFNNLLDERIENINDFYKSRIENDDKFHLNPKYLYLNKNELNKILNKFQILDLYNYKFDNKKFIFKKISNISSIKKEIDFKFINKFFEINKKNKIIICTSSEGTSERIKKIFLNELNLNFLKINNYSEIIKKDNLYITILKIEHSIQNNDLIFLNEKTIFGYNFSIKQTKNLKREVFFEEINKFKKNNILVHNDYGFCRFLDIKKIDINESLHDCLELEFADNQKVFLPIENLNFITKYGNDDDKNVNLDKLGTASWQKRRSQAKNRIKDIAKKLMSIAAKRMNSEAYKINFDSILYEKFSSTFPFVETDDQLKSIEDIKSDFKKLIPADRLIVGDVAFGKTEVIMRAVFLAAKSNLQSLILVPTTLLSRQHYNNFYQRLSIFNIRVKEISRLINDNEKKITIESLMKGTTDVIIGTHALLSNKIKFKKLGLIIYDEEQKLGTKQKEKFKNLAPKAHVISLSATPIPRTLSLSLSGIRDLSLILTAPYERLSIRTFILPFDTITISEAIKREIIGRRGSVFFVTPRTKDIPFIEKFLKDNLPKIEYVTAHGKLNTKILEQRINKFYDKKVPLMISTNIIENGLDLPHVNTIIIYRSNLFSLSALYQLKGRVGRSSKRGYAYLSYNEKEVTDNAHKRLNIINSFDEIGSGFNIASQDLDIRGSGSIIGEEQSGFVKEVGTELYQQMLEEEIIKQKKSLIEEDKKYQKNKFQPSIQIPEPIFIPDYYINDLDIKMSIYKRISFVSNNVEKEELMIELIDRFGKMPNEVENLFKLIEIKILCLKNNLEEIKYGKKGIIFKFFQNKPLYPEKILDMSLSKNNNFTIRSDQKLFYDFKVISKISKFELIKKIIETFF